VKKLLVLNLDGDFDTGFDVNWEIGPDGQLPFANGMSRLALAPRPSLERAYKDWCALYHHLDGRRIKLKSNQITNVRYTDLISQCRSTADLLTREVNEWFESSPLSRIVETDLLTNLQDEYRVIICTNNPEVRQIPWLLWSGWDRFEYLEISLGATYTQRRDRIYHQQVRVLAILGNNDGIDIEADRQILERYRRSGAFIEFLAQPTIAELSQQLLDTRGWDIISFSGHSHTESVSSGRIFINQTDSLTMGQLRGELTTAIEKGLQLAIFNSCDGLGIAAELESLYIPQTIVMRQPVPDLVAHNFLKYFLAEFTTGKSLYQSVRIAREQIKELESKFPCASWLPVIIQNRLEVPPTWQSLGSIPSCPYQGFTIFRSENSSLLSWQYIDRSALIEAIVSPAQQLNVRFENGLIDLVLAPVLKNNHSLLLLEFVLPELWKRQENGYLTLRAYEDIGGLEGILVDRAEDVYQQLTPKQQAQTHQIFSQLVRVGDRIAPTSRTAKISECGADNWETIEYLADRGLVAIGWDEKAQEKTVELIHESLIDRWHTFKSWIASDRDFRSWQEQLRSDIDRWQQNHYSPTSTIRGSAIDIALDWLKDNYAQISPLEREFINLSLKRQRQDIKAKRRFWQVVVVTSIIVALIFAQLWQRSESEKQAAVISNINSLRYRSTSFINSGQQLAALEQAQKAAEQLGKEQNLDSDTRLPAILAFGEILDRIREKNPLTTKATAHHKPVTSVTSSQDGKIVASVADDGQLNIYDAENRIQTLPEKDASDAFFKVLISSDGRDIITASSPNILKLWQQSPQTGEWGYQRIPVNENDISAIALRNTDRILAVAFDGGELRLYRDFKQLPSKLERTSGYIQDLKFTPDGQKIIAAKANGTIEIYTIKTGQIFKTIGQIGEKIITLDLSPDGTKIATGGENGTIALWNFETGKLLAKRTDGDSRIIALNFSPDSQLLASGASEDSNVKIWSINDKKLSLSLSLPGQSEVQSLTFKGNNTLISGNSDGNVSQWQLNNSNPNLNIPDDANTFSYSHDRKLLAFGTFDRHNSGISILDREHQKELISFDTKHISKITGISISSDNQYIATVASDINSINIFKTNNSDEIKIFKMSDGKEILPSTPLTGKYSSFSPNRALLAISTTDDRVIIYDITTHKVLTLGKEESNITYLSFNPDGSRIVTASKNGIKIWNVNGGKPQFVPSSNNLGSIRDLSYSPDGQKIAIASQNEAQGTVTILLANGKLSKTYPVSGINTLAFSQDGKVILTGNDRVQLQLWNLEGELLHSISEDSRSEIIKVRFGLHDREIVALDFMGKTIYHDLNLERLLERAKAWQKQ
jgi:WD40 repeat protein